MGYTAADVKRLREATDAPMLECKSALEEANGSFDRAKEILREKGKSAAAKRVGRSTSAGVVAFSADSSGEKVAGIVLECETDFVARTEDFIATAQEIADLIREHGQAAGEKVQERIETAVAKIRENIRVSKTVLLDAGKPVVTYVHHDRSKGSAIVIEGEPNDALRKVAIQIVAFPPDVVSKDQLSQAKIDSEIEIETQRAIHEGKQESIARNIALGRVNKEFIKRTVLLEQAFYADATKTVEQYLKESGNGAKVSSFEYLAVGQGD